MSSIPSSVAPIACFVGGEKNWKRQEKSVGEKRMESLHERNLESMKGQGGNSAVNKVLSWAAAE